MSLVEVQGLRFSYDGTLDVLHAIKLSLADGQNLLVIGDNGSGKTTLGRTLAGLIKPTAGTITIAGRVPAEVAVDKRCQLVSYMSPVSHLSVLTSSIAKEVASFSQGVEPLATEEAYQGWARRHLLPENTNMNPRDLTMPDLWRLLLGLYVVILQPAVLIVDEVLCPSNKQQHNCSLETLESRKQQGKATIFLYQRGLSLPFDVIGELRNGTLSISLT